MDRNEDIINKVRELTQKLTPLGDMAVLLGVSRVELVMELNDMDSPISQVYHLEKAKVSLEIREQNIELARAGSPTSTLAVANYLKDMDNDEP